MSVSVREPLPFEVSQAGNFEARMLRHFRAFVDDWDEVCSALGAWEAEHLTAEEPSATKEQHRGWVSELLSWGRLMQRATEQSEFPDKTLAVRVNARLRHLQDKLALWHADMTVEEEDQILLTTHPTTGSPCS